RAYDPCLTCATH
ncbi:MAG: hypothetical protein CO159_01035, partial [Candidatus Portnoybacteria bacterium CG_4_9_14_3_um_filter_40_10]